MNKFIDVLRDFSSSFFKYHFKALIAFSTKFRNRSMVLINTVVKRPEIRSTILYIYCCSSMTWRVVKCKIEWMIIGIRNSLQELIEILPRHTHKYICHDAAILSHECNYNSEYNCKI